MLALRIAACVVWCGAAQAAARQDGILTSGAGEGAAAAAGEISHHLPCPWPPCAVCAGPEGHGPETNFSSFYLPDLLLAADGSRVATAEAWAGTRRQEIQELLQLHMFGALPTGPDPTIVAAERLPSNYSDPARGFANELFNVTYRGGGHVVSSVIELIVPTDPSVTGKGLLPLFVSEGTHRSWAMRAVATMPQ